MPLKYATCPTLTLRVSPDPVNPETCHSNPVELLISKPPPDCKFPPTTHVVPLQAMVEYIPDGGGGTPVVPRLIAGVHATASADHWIGYSPESPDPSARIKFSLTIVPGKEVPDGALNELVTRVP